MALAARAQALKQSKPVAPAREEKSPSQRLSGPSEEQRRELEVKRRIAALKADLLERYPHVREQPPQVGAARVISDELYKGERLIMLQQGHGWALLRGAEAKEVVHQLEGKGPSAQLTSRAQVSGQLKPGAVVRLDGDLKTVWAYEQRSREQKIELERQLKAMQPKRDRGPDR